MNVLLRLLAWLLAITIVVLPVVAVLNGWVGAERWPLAKLRVPVDAFFDDVMVMDKDEKIKNNRLGLLKSIDQLVSRIADFTKIVLA